MIRRRARRRVATLTRDDRHDDACGIRPASDPLVALAGTVAWILEGTGSGRSASTERAARRVQGVGLVLAGVCALVSPSVGIGVACVGWHLPRVAAARRRRRWAAALHEETLLATELCAVAVHTGATVPGTIAAVAPHLDGPLGVELRRVLSWYRAGRLLDDGLAAVTSDLGGTVAPLTALLRAAHTDGDAVGPALERLSDRLREGRRRALEEEVRRLSVRLLVPLVCCSLPGFVLVAVVPFALGALGGLGR